MGTACRPRDDFQSQYPTTLIPKMATWNFSYQKLFFSLAFLTMAVSTGWARPAAAQITFTGNTGGILQLSADGTRLETATDATVNIEAQPNINAQVSLFGPTLSSGPTNDPAGSSASASAIVGGSTVTTAGGSAPLPSSPTDVVVTNVSLSMQVQRPFLFPAGSYTYQVIMTVTLN